MANLLQVYRGSQVGKGLEMKLSLSPKVGGGIQSITSGLFKGLKSFFGGLVKVGTFLFGNILAAGLSAIWGGCVSLFFAIWNFNWTQSDEELDALTKQLKQTLSGMFGGLLGNALGWIVCGILPGVVITRFNAALGAYVLKEVGEEALDELIGNLSAIARYSAQTLLRIFFNNLYKGIRSIFFTDTKFTRGLAKLLGINYDEARNNYLQKKTRHWSFASQFNEFINNIPNPYLQDFVEEFFDEFSDACIEAGFVVANSVESYMAMQKQTQTSILGVEQGVEIQPDRTEEEKYVLVGPQEILKQQIVSHVTNHQFIGYRDLGYITGESELTAKIPTSKKTLVINWRNFERPPWNRRKSGLIYYASRCVLEDLQNNITWAELKLAVKKFTTGDVRVTGCLSNGGRLSILANTTDEGEEKLTALSKLTMNEITRFTSGKQKLTLINRKPATGDRKRGDIRDEVLMYPAFAYFISRHPWREGGKDQPAKPDGYSSLSDAYYTKRQRFDLYVDNQPINYPTLL